MLEPFIFFHNNSTSQILLSNMEAPHTNFLESTKRNHPSWSTLNVSLYLNYCILLKAFSGTQYTKTKLNSRSLTTHCGSWWLLQTQHTHIYLVFLFFRTQWTRTDLILRYFFRDAATPELQTVTRTTKKNLPKSFSHVRFLKLYGLPLLMLLTLRDTLLFYTRLQNFVNSREYNADWLFLTRTVPWR